MRVTLIMPDELVSKIDEQSKKLGVTRTAYMVMTMSQKIQGEEVIRSVPALQDMMNQMQVKLSKMSPEEVKEALKGIE